MDAEKKLTMQEAAGKGLLSPDVAEEKREQMKRLFPEVFTDGNIDFDQLRRVMGDWVEPGKERYGLNWPGKADCMKVIQAPSIATLKPDRDESVNFDDTENLFIEGDNLEVLKLLQKAYFGKIKMVYIDPPYNTGNEFIYPDKYQENLETYLAYTRQIDDEGKKYSTNSEVNGRFHSNWLNMMYPRLYLARNLLRNDGIIFISIGDQEYANLKKICDNIFGAKNFILTISRVMKTGGAKGHFFTPNVDFILVYAKDIDETEYFRTRITQAQIEGYYSKIQEDGPRKGENYGEERLYKASLDVRPNQRYWIECPDGYFAIPPGVTFLENIADGEKVTPNDEDGVWKWTFSTYKREYDDGNIVFKETTTSALVNQNKNPSKWNIYNKLWLREQQEKGKVPSNYLDKFENRQSAAELKKIEIPFDYAKPISLIRHLIEISRAKDDDIVLDFFAGAASTAVAVMQDNVETAGRRRCILVQLPEFTKEDSEEYKAGYKTVSDIGKERIRRAARKILDNNEEKLDLKGAKKIDFGFRVFKLSNSNLSIWDGDADRAEDLATQLEMHVDHIDQESGPEDILYELLLKAGFELTTKVEMQTMASKCVYAVADGALLICLDKEITPELIDALADADPLQVICLDEGLKGNDQLKTNAVQTFKSRSKEDEEAIVFRTV